MMLPFTEYLPNIKRELLFRKVSSAPNENNSSLITFRVAFEADKLASKTNPVWTMDNKSYLDELFFHEYVSYVLLIVDN